MVPFAAIRCVIALSCAALSPGAAQAQSLSERVAEHIRQRLEAAGTAAAVSLGGELVFAVEALPSYYRRAGYRPAWSGDRGVLPRAFSLLEALRGAEQEGLRAEDYHLERLASALRDARSRQLSREPPDAERLAELDLLLSDAFLVYASHLALGRVNPETIHPEWKANRRGVDLTSALERVVAGDDPGAVLRELTPAQEEYARLREALSRYLRLAAQGGWVPIEPGPPLGVGSRSARVAALRARLEATGDLGDTAVADTDLFDEALASAVRRFQSRHGLEVNGRADSATIAALNVPAEERARQIALNLERWRWMPEELGSRYIVVNIAGFDLRVVEREETVLEMRVMVGRPYRRTPVFSDTVRYLVLSPYWHVPHNIAVQDILPRIKRDPSYLTQQGFTVFEGWGPNARVVDPASVDWSKVTAANFPYRLRQDPGPLNALGRVKFMFPNKYNVYLHDTPSRELFDRPERDFSSGCVRVEKPIELAEYLLADPVQWSRERIIAAIDRRVEQTVRLSRPIPIHIQYWTVWVAEDGTVHFRRDLYGRDQMLAAALARSVAYAGS
ncbi:hypothetical protein HRbin33_01030 [bacterium HR33]|nr:hypothetical protein HRbin33_01030 [bacterium HR33]